MVGFAWKVRRKTSESSREPSYSHENSFFEGITLFSQMVPISRLHLQTLFWPVSSKERGASTPGEAVHTLDSTWLNLTSPTNMCQPLWVTIYQPFIYQWPGVWPLIGWSRWCCWQHATWATAQRNQSGESAVVRINSILNLRNHSGKSVLYIYIYMYCFCNN